MEIENRSTGKKYQVSQEGWDSLGKRQNAFKVNSYIDTEEIKAQTVSNNIGLKKQDLEKKSEKTDGKESKKQTKQK